MQTYKGKFTPQNPDKYLGNPKGIVYRSLWERNCFRWLDENTTIVSWASEEIAIPYICLTDKKQHKYYPDIFFKTKEGKKFLIEIKPEAQTKPPTPGKKTRRLVEQTLTYAKNISKWRAAEEFCKDNGVTFAIWDENMLRSLGIKIIK
jgi:hypothetical protein